MKTNSVRGDEIEFLSKIGQGSLPFDSTDDARYVQEGKRRAEHRIVIGIEAERVVAKISADEKEVTRAAAEIENARWWRAIEPNVLRAFNVDVDPIRDILEAIDPRRTGPIRKLLAQLLEFRAIQTCQNARTTHWMQRSAGMFPDTGQRIARKQFLELARKSHFRSYPRRSDAVKAF